MKRIMFLLLMVATVVDVSVTTNDACAIVGRPLTPMSYAGVARRTTRRAAVVGAAAAPVYVAPPAAAYW
ncbi:MAG TPA: hypothetical protein VH054_22940 [Polyangiaceae bacterium]|jgi:hypothetical protein|nr:hypothetical protein [Polyangiaceae bacterium]